MSLTTHKVLRTISKIVLILSGVAILGYVGYVTYLSVTYKPMKVRVTNITESSATVTWVTDTPMSGVIYYAEKDSFLPGPLSWIGKPKAWDDRDVSDAQSKCVADYNANLDVDSDFNATGEDMDCTDVKVKIPSKYYTHSVTLTDLDSEKEYYFRVGDGVWSWDVDSNSVETFSVLTDVEEPKPVFGKIVTESGDVSEDSLVYIQFTDGSESTDSILMSSVANGDGGWYLDGSNVRDIDGNVLDLELAQDSFVAQAQYMNNELSEEYPWVFGYFNAAYPDIVVSDHVEASLFDGLVMGAYADDCSYSNLAGCSTTELQANISDWGYGRVTQAIANNENGGVINANVLTAAGLGGTSTQIAGNLQAITGHQVTAKQVDDSQDSGGNYHVSAQNSGTGWTISFQDPASGGGANLDDGETTSSTGLIYTLSSIPSGVTSWGDLTVGGTKLSDLVSNDVLKNMGTPSKGDKICIGGSENNSGCSLTLNPVSVNIVTLANAVVDDYTGGDSTQLETVKGYLESALAGYENSPDTAIVNKLQATLNKVNNTIDDGVADTEVTDPESHIVTNIDELYASGTWWERSGWWDTDVSSTTITTKIFNSGNTKLLLQWDESSTYNTPGKFQYIQCVKGCPSLMSPNPYTIEDFAKWLEVHGYTNSFVEEVMGDTVSSTVKETTTTSNESSETTTANTYEEYVAQNILGDDVDWEEDSGTVKYKTIQLPYEDDPTLIRVSNNKVYCDSGCPEGVNANTPYSANAFAEAIASNENSISDDFIIEMFGEDALDGLDESTDGAFNWLDGLVKGAYASETTDTSSYFYLPEYGFYTLEMEGVELGEKVQTGDNTIYFFYVEANGEDGFQMPADIDNPTSDEDIVLQSDAFEIQYSKVAKDQTIDLVEGINIVSFNNVLSLADFGVGGTAMELILWAQDKGIDIEAITYFANGKWSGGVHCDGDTKEECAGIDFDLVPGRGYLILSGEDASLSVPVYTLESSVPISLSSGWNLVGINGYTTKYTASSFISSVNKIDGLTADNVTWWPTSKGKYEGIQVTNGTTYGQDFAISSSNGYFVRISDFDPTNSSCKSLIWHDGGDLNGVCGNSESVF